MSARKKLNQGYFQGCLLLAGVVGFFCQSWTVFWITAAILTATSLHSGEIRMTGRTRDRSSQHDQRRRNRNVDRRP